MRFARWLFLIAGASGLLALLPHYALESWIGREFPPAISHPEFYYGFVGVAAAWQVVFLVIATDPARYRPLMLVGVLEKVSFGGAVLALFAGGACRRRCWGRRPSTCCSGRCSCWPSGRPRRGGVAPRARPARTPARHRIGRPEARPASRSHRTASRRVASRRVASSNARRGGRIDES